MRIIFETPSKRCPSRRWNGREIGSLQYRGQHQTRRAGWVPVYAAQVMENGFPVAWITAFGDELFLDPIVGKDYNDETDVYASEVEAGLAKECAPPRRVADGSVILDLLPDEPAYTRP